MSRRVSIVNALVNKLKDINGTGIYTSNIYGNAFPFIKFWDETQNFPSIYTAPGPEQREYLPGGFKWGFMHVAFKMYTKGENAQSNLEALLADVEKCLDANNNLIYDPNLGSCITDIRIQTIVTDEGLLAPYAVGEITATIQYQIL